jgi:hypothetical protein
MYDDLLAPDGLIATRLDYLFRTVHPDGRGPYSPREVADLINRAPGEHVISADIIKRIRDGRRRTFPPYWYMAELARFFGVRLMFFLNEADHPRGEGPIPGQSSTPLPSAGKGTAAVHAAGTLSGSLWATAQASGRPAEAGR